MDNVLDCKVSFSTGSTGQNEIGYQVGDQWTSCDLEYLWGYYPRYYPVYVDHKDKVTQSFKIVSKLLEKKIIKKDLTIKDFIELVNTIADIL